MVLFLKKKGQIRKKPFNISKNDFVLEFQGESEAYQIPPKKVEIAVPSR
jgi:hypothetical protein